MKNSGTGRKIGWRTLAAALVCLAGGGGLFAAQAINAAPPAKPAYLAAFPNFAPKLTPQMPGDVDIALKTQLEKAQKFSEVQREFDLYSWQMFLALNWPTNSQGQAAPKLTDTGSARRTGRCGTIPARSSRPTAPSPPPAACRPRRGPWSCSAATWPSRSARGWRRSRPRPRPTPTRARPGSWACCRRWAS
jgi:hypothetical protein